MTASKNSKKRASGGSNGAANFSNTKAPRKDDKRKSVGDDAAAAAEIAKSTPLKDTKEVCKAAVVDPDQDEHPLKTSNYLVVKYRDGSHRLAKIIEKNSKVVEKKTVWQYYVHYNDFNRRMDEWIISDRIVQLPSTANILGAEYAAAHSHGPADDKKVPTGDRRHN